MRQRTPRRVATRPLALRSSAMAVCTMLFGAEAGAQQDAITLPTVNVTASQYDPDDVRPEGVTTATKTYLAPKDIPQTIDTRGPIHTTDGGAKDGYRDAVQGAASAA